jgi:benzoyl-CoA reductase/2-hydroxyglutaryl-CoA dehydratase subunit BcrC/BadD/HgdB
MVEVVASGIDAAALVLTTACDQMRYAAAVVDHEGHLPVFLMHVPSTWQTAASAEMYVEELKRLGRFMVTLGGRSPGRDEFVRVILMYEAARGAVCEARGRISSRRLAQAIAEVRGEGKPTLDLDGDLGQADAVPLALVGGPLAQDDLGIFDVVEQAGARIVLDASETGERTLPGPTDKAQLERDPLPALADAYFGSIPDVFRRPNHGLHEWIAEEIAAREVRGIILRRYLWCDLWNAETERLRQWSPVPVLTLDVSENGDAMSRTRGRVEAFLETISC